MTHKMLGMVLDAVDSREKGQLDPAGLFVSLTCC